MVIANETEEITNQLKNFSITEIESYLEVILTKCMEAIIKDDLPTYTTFEKTLNQSIIIFNSRVRNFNILYTGVKLRVANKFLKKSLNVTDLSILDNISTSEHNFLTVEEADKITKSEGYLKYIQATEYAKQSLDSAEVYVNDRYFFTTDNEKLLDKESKYYCTANLEGNEELFKAFLTKDSAILNEVEKTLLTHDLTLDEIAKQEAKLEEETYIDPLTSKEQAIYFKDVHDLTGDIYYNENNVFIVCAYKYIATIYHRRTGTSVDITITEGNDWFIKDFVNYCLGKNGIVISELHETDY